MSPGEARCPYASLPADSRLVTFPEQMHACTGEKNAYRDAEEIRLFCLVAYGQSLKIRTEDGNNQETALMMRKLMTNASEGAMTQFAIIFLIKANFTVSIPFDIPTPLIAPIMQ